jgi:hypothetical protein
MADGAVVAKRNLIKIKRSRAARLHDAAADHVHPAVRLRLRQRHRHRAVNYREFLIAGSSPRRWCSERPFTGAGIADDMQKGIIDRFRSLPMRRSAVLIGDRRATSV